MIDTKAESAAMLNTALYVSLIINLNICFKSLFEQFNGIKVNNSVADDYYNLLIGHYFVSLFVKLSPAF